MANTLWQQIQATRLAALANGVLQPIYTEVEIVSETIGNDTFTYQLRTLSSLEQKDNEQRIKQAGSHRVNPFQPYDPQLFVSTIGNHHIGLLNKFNVIDNHLLIVTREFEPQTNLLTVADFSAALTGLKAINGLVFFNGGVKAGASQPHKHLQLIPLSPQELPLAQPLSCFLTEPQYNPKLPFRQVGIRLPNNLVDDTTLSAQWLHDAYLTLLDILKIDQQHQATKAYNLLLNREWLMLVPRRTDSFASISFNALAFCGALLVKNSDQAQMLKAAGITQALRNVSE
ncbi:DUF4922 domain-containing protein [Amphritea sp. 2_MG-2023]|uniref:ATP adenylyltransferase family protein n=1 Tax=Amphritea TaxID=515417 RepID=UPI001C07065E|nr:MULTISPECIES: DUF4922 domain-containing protein [Amphritea]MBU2965580.1 hypothetical protein [Amphritea atlantica]MDO6418735.1 DUF4922 domain-containing protein [Amphritea sp. 2_MG-2023]